MQLDTLAYLRYNRNYIFMASEVLDSDILVYNKKRYYEFEIKTSKGDLKNDFKKYKHIGYTRISKRFIPNYFSFVVPIDLAEYALDLVKERNNNYGILQWKCSTIGKYKLHPNIVVIKRPKLLVEKSPEYKYIRKRIVKRMISQIIIAEIKLIKLKRKLK